MINWAIYYQKRRQCRTAHPMTEALRPALNQAASQAKPQTGGPQVALLVGPEGENVWTDALGRIKVQFPWTTSTSTNTSTRAKARTS